MRHGYTSMGTYSVQLTVTNNLGETDTIPQDVPVGIVAPAPPP